VPEISISDAQVSESAGTASFTVSLSKASASNVTVNYTTGNGSAISPDDYTASAGTLTFLPGDSLTQAVTVPIVDDLVAESSETFAVTLSSAVGGTIIDNAATGTILDNEISACGAPTYSKNTDLGVFLWRNCSTSLWSVRVSGGTGAFTYAGSVQSNTPFTSVVPFSIESNDSLDFTTDPAVISPRMASTSVSRSRQTCASAWAPARASRCSSARRKRRLRRRSIWPISGSATSAQQAFGFKPVRVWRSMAARPGVEGVPAPAWAEAGASHHR
jgi:hypothetical protein